MQTDASLFLNVCVLCLFMKKVGVYFLKCFKIGLKTETNKETECLGKEQRSWGWRDDSIVK